jgi:tRNA (guanine37-N1)-methyltransferase
VSEAHFNATLDIPPLTETLPELRASLAEATVLVARAAGRLVGSVRGQLEADGAWYIGRLMVAPDLQGQGMGSRLMDAIEALSPEGTVIARLFTGAKSAANLAFYARRGYLETNRFSTPGRVLVVVLERRLGG